jgi:hypothetical protein
VRIWLGTQNSTPRRLSPGEAVKISVPALTIVKSDEATLEQKTLAGGYIALEGTAHAALVVGAGALACVVAGPGCAKAVEGVLGIGGTAGKAACADGDCTNEVNAIPATGNTVINFLSNQINRVRHIMQSKHGWDRLTTLSGDLSKDYKAIQPYIQQTINNGVVKQITTTFQGNPVFQYEATINGQVVVVNAVTLANGVIQVTDAWVIVP